MLESISDSVATDESRSLDDLTPFGVPLGDYFKPKMTTLNLRSDCEARLITDLEVLIPIDILQLDGASEWKEGDNSGTDFTFSDNEPRSAWIEPKSSCRVFAIVHAIVV